MRGDTRASVHGDASDVVAALLDRSPSASRRSHTAATVTLERGAPLEVVSAVLGHASLAITADAYARPAADAKRRALEAVSESFATIAIV